MKRGNEHLVMDESEIAVLTYEGDEKTEYCKIFIDKPKFTIGRSKDASYIIYNVGVSKVQCTFEKTGEEWTVCDKSTFGTFLNGEKLQKDIATSLKDGDEIKFGPHKSIFIYTFHSNTNQSSKKMRWAHNDERQSLESRLQELRDTQEQMKSTQESEQLLQEKQTLEEKIKEMQKLLEEKEKAEQELNRKLEEKEAERLRDLQQLREQRDAQVEQLQKEVMEREEVMRLQLQKEIENLSSEKTKLESDIKEELLKKAGESAENLKQMQDELEKVKRDLTNVEGKKMILEKELEETTKAKEDASESSLKAKQEMLENFGELMETELQCSVCNELFVTATTLNCTHTFCKFCIQEWKKKKKDCPVCRTKITSENRSIALDNFIDKMVSNLSEELRNRRQEIVEERLVQELLGPKTSSEPQKKRRGRAQNIPSSSSRNTGTNDVIVISSESSSSEDEDEDSFMTSDSNSDSYVEGDPDAYYGGYGVCFNCGLDEPPHHFQQLYSDKNDDEPHRNLGSGRRGHWAHGCPY